MKKNRRNSTQPDASDNSRDTQNLKRKGSSTPQYMSKDVSTILQDMHEHIIQPMRSVENFQEELVAEFINTSETTIEIVRVGDVTLLQKDMQCLTQEFEDPKDSWLNGDVRLFLC